MTYLMTHRPMSWRHQALAGSADSPRGLFFLPPRMPTPLLVTTQPHTDLAWGACFLGPSCTLGPALPWDPAPFCLSPTYPHVVCGVLPELQPTGQGLDCPPLDSRPPWDPEQVRAWCASVSRKVDGSRCTGRAHSACRALSLW